MTKKNYENARTRYYGENAKIKTGSELSKTTTKKSPRSSFEDGDTFKFLPKSYFEIVEEKIEGFNGTVESFLVEHKGSYTKFFVSWLAKSGYSVYGYATSKEDCVRQDSKVADKVSDNCGDVFDTWQSATNQADAIGKLAGKEVTVHIVAYYHDQWSENPKPVFEFSFA